MALGYKNHGAIILYKLNIETKKGEVLGQLMINSLRLFLCSKPKRKE